MAERSVAAIQAMIRQEKGPKARIPQHTWRAILSLKALPGYLYIVKLFHDRSSADWLVDATLSPISAAIPKIEHEDARVAAGGRLEHLGMTERMHRVAISSEPPLLNRLAGEFILF
jgi:hypothetical protein